VTVGTARVNLGLSNHELITMTSGGNLTVSGTLDATKLSGSLPAISGASLTGIQAFPSGTKMTFFQVSAPTGWTQDTSNDDAALRVVSGTGGGTGGSSAFSAVFTHTHAHTLAISDTTLTESQMPTHRHYTIGESDSDWPGGVMDGYAGNARGSSGGLDNDNYYYGTSDTGGGTGHSHGTTGSITSATIAPKYVDMIIASKD
jgi:hypothetical protein